MIGAARRAFDRPRIPAVGRPSTLEPLDNLLDILVVGILEWVGATRQLDHDAGVQPADQVDDRQAL